jgi:hypothetical protein
LAVKIREEIMRKDSNLSPDFFNISYGLASVAITSGNNVIATTSAAYYGCAVVAGLTSTATVIVYDNAATASGAIIEHVKVGDADSALNERYNPIMAKNGLFLVATGTGVQGSVFFGPKG